MKVRLPLLLMLLCSAILLTNGAKLCKKLDLPDTMTRTKITSKKGAREIGVKFKLECKEGYVLKGEDTIKCVRERQGKDPKWSDKIPTCKLRKSSNCDYPPPSTASLTKIVKGELESYCPGKTVKFDCVEGAVHVSGNFERTLKDDGNWTGEMLQCEKKCCDEPNQNSNQKTCPAPLRPAYGQILNQKATYIVGDLVYYKCIKGYYLYGHPSQECLPNETWCGLQPKCQRFSCPPIRPPVNGFIASRGFHLVRFSCNDGYDLIGNDTRICMPTGKWNGRPPTCLRNCGGCKVLKTIQLPASRSCGKTIGSLVADHAVDGRNLLTFRNCAVTCLYQNEVNEREFGTKNPRLWIDMKREYDVSGVTVQGVTKIGHDSVQKFRLSYAERLPFAGNITDISGFEIHVSKSWNSPSPKTDDEERSRALQCGRRQDTLQSRSKYDVCCDEYVRGRYLTIHVPGNHKVLAVCEVTIYVRPYDNNCLKSPKYLESTAVKGCSDPGKILNGKRLPEDKDHFNVDENVTFVCSKCFELHGDRVIICGRDGTWKYKTFPQCIKKSCNARAVLSPNNSAFCTYEDFPHGTVLPERESGHALVNETISFKCNQNYLLKGSEKLTCVGNCVWSDYWPECISKTCTHPSDPYNGKFIPINKAHSISSEVTLGCDQGYKVKGQATVACNSSLQWSPELPTCEDVVCSKPKLKKNVLITPNKKMHTYNSEVTFFCLKSWFKLNGSKTATCNEAGEWTSQSPVCTDPCENKACDVSRYQKVILDNKNQCTCVCKDESDCSEIADPVCGSNGLTYKTECHLQSQACLTKKYIIVVAKEPCKYGGVCSAPKPSGPCPAYENKWYYNSEREECQRFLHGSCFQGINVFDTEHECYKTCQCEVFCKQPKDIGPCRNTSKARYYFSYSDGTCKPLYYKGCFGNNNNFPTKNSCEKICRDQVRYSIILSEACKNRHNLTMTEACKNRKSNSNNFMITITVDSTRTTRFNENGFIATVGKKYWGPPSLIEFNQIFLIMKGTLRCPCRALLQKEQYLITGILREGKRWPEFSDRSLVYAFANYQKLESKVQEACPELYL